MNSTRLTAVIFTLFMAVLWFPAIQKIFTLKWEKPLMGDIPALKEVRFSWDNWTSEEYQKYTVEKINQSFGFRPYFVRLHNQLCFSLFNKANARDIIVGKKNYLFEKKYIDSFLGKDFIGENKIAEQVNKLKIVADSLLKRNIKLFVMISPGKGFFFPEYIPEKLLKQKKITNYEVYLMKFKESGINCVDFNKYFLEQKKTSRYPMFPKTGVHWSSYGVSLVTDSLIKYIESTLQCDLPGIVTDTVEIPRIPRNYDMDIEDAMNLLFSIKKPRYGYPVYHFEEKPDAQKPSVLTIGDSFWWGIYYSQMSEKVLSAHEFLYYNMQSYKPGDPAPKDVNTDSYIKNILSYNIIILQSSEGLLQSFPWGFTDIMFSFFTKLDFDKRVEMYIQKIKSDPAWLDTVTKKALENNIPLEEMIKKDAVYMVETEG